MYACADCRSAACCDAETGPFPKDCPTRDLDKDELLEAYGDGVDGDRPAGRCASRPAVRPYDAC